jgi:hypothetical protein
MKRILLFSALTCILLVACRKMVLRDVNPDIVVNQCENAVMDGDEIGVDCGGSECISCTQTTPPCALNTNELIISTNGVSYMPKALINLSLDTTGGTWKFTGYTNPSYYLFIRFDSKPSVNTVYDGNSNTTLAANEAFVTYYQPGLENLTGEGDVYVNFNSGEYSITSCNFGFHLPSQSPPSFTQSFNLTIN